MKLNTEVGMFDKCLSCPAKTWYRCDDVGVQAVTVANRMGVLKELEGVRSMLSLANCFDAVEHQLEDCLQSAHSLFFCAGRLLLV